MQHPVGVCKQKQDLAGSASARFPAKSTLDNFSKRQLRRSNGPQIEPQASIDTSETKIQQQQQKAARSMPSSAAAALLTPSRDAALARAAAVASTIAFQPRTALAFPAALNHRMSEVGCRQHLEAAAAAAIDLGRDRMPTAVLIHDRLHLHIQDLQRRHSALPPPQQTAYSSACKYSSFICILFNKSSPVLT